MTANQVSHGEPFWHEKHSIKYLTLSFYLVLIKGLKEDVHSLYLHSLILVLSKLADCALTAIIVREFMC